MTLFLTSESTDPFENLAIERVLFESIGRPIPAGTMNTLTADEVTAKSGAPPAADAGPGPPAATLTGALLVYKNAPCVVIGRHQNPWTECDLASMARDGVPLVRRISGGGAVYHDPGNLNFCFLGDHESYDLDRHFAVVTKALENLGIRAHRNERNDILLDGPDPVPGHGASAGAGPALPAKISGNAFRHTKNASMHHGTLLVKADLDRLISYLHSPTNPDSRTAPAGHPGARSGTGAISAEAAVTSSKAIASVRSSVANLADVRSDLSLDHLIAALDAAYRESQGPTARIAAPAFVAAVSADRRLASSDEELRSWEWRYGKTPAFSFRAASARAASGPGLLFDVRGGRVSSVSSAAGSAVPHDSTRLLADALIGVQFRRDDLLEAICSLPSEAQELVRTVAEALPETP